MIEPVIYYKGIAVSSGEAEIKIGI